MTGAPRFTVADIFKEVDEDLRRDRAEQVWKKYGKNIIGVALLFVLAVALYEVWTWWDVKQRSERSDRYAGAVALLQSGDSAAAAAAFGELAGPDGAYGTLASFNKARLLAEAGDTAAAIEIWDSMAESTAAGAAFQGAATLLSVLHQIDSGDVAALEARLEPLSQAGSGFRPMALEMSAILAMRQGDMARTKELYAQIADDRTAPSGLRARASQMLGALGE